MSYRVLIPTAGTGSRLGKLTKYLNKSLISVANRPVISHIIDKYPVNCEFVIPLGYQGNLVKDFLNLAYPDRNFIFEEIHPFIGKGSGLGFTLFSCKNHLQQPFIFHSCDTLIEEDVPSPVNNWMGYSGANINQINSYRTLKIEKNKVLSIREKGDELYSNTFPYIGLSSVANYLEFWENMSEGKDKAIDIGEVYGFKNLTSKINAIFFTWQDTGQIESLEIAREKYKQKDSPNILEKENETIWFTSNKLVIKYSNDKEFIKNRIKRSKLIEEYVPKITGTSSYMYSYNLVQGDVISKSINPVIFKSLLAYCKKFWEKYELDSNSMSYFTKICKEFYKNKTYKRLSNYYNKFNVLDRDNLLNGVEVPDLDFILSELNWSEIIIGTPGRFHGDFHFENIIIDKKNNSFKFIDWRQDFGGDLSTGDIYYDLSKLLHGIIINHSIINKNLFWISIDDDNYSVNFDFNRKNSLVECENYFYEWLTSENYNLKKVKIITGLIYLNIASLHHFPYCNLLYYLGKEMLFNEIIKE